MSTRTEHACIPTQTNNQLRYLSTRGRCTEFFEPSHPIHIAPYMEGKCHRSQPSRNLSPPISAATFGVNTCWHKPRSKRRPFPCRILGSLLEEQTCSLAPPDILFVLPIVYMLANLPRQKWILKSPLVAFDPESCSHLRRYFRLPQTSTRNYLV